MDKVLFFYTNIDHGSKDVIDHINIEPKLLNDSLDKYLELAATQTIIYVLAKVATHDWINPCCPITVTCNHNGATICSAVINIEQNDLLNSLQSRVEEKVKKEIEIFGNSILRFIIRSKIFRTQNLND